MKFCWLKNSSDPIQLIVTLELASEGIYRWVRNLIGPEFPNTFDSAIQIIHELLLVPSTFFLDGRAPVHGAAISVGGKAAVFSGTGGFGKSSALLRLANLQRHDMPFMADDMPILGNTETLFGNMAFPQI